MNRAMLIILIVFLFLPTNIFAEDCTTLSPQQKIILKFDSMKNSLRYSFILDSNKKIDYQLKLADTLYSLAAKTTDPNLAYTLSLRAEDQITQSVQALQQLPNSAHFDLSSFEQYRIAHKNIIMHMTGNCNWKQIDDFIESNFASVKKLYFSKLPTDTGMQLY